MCRDKSNNPHSERNVPVFYQDLNCLPYQSDTCELHEDQQGDQISPEWVDNRSSSYQEEKADGNLIFLKNGLTMVGLQTKKKRAAAERIANIGLEDLAKYFDHPIAEASRKLDVGLSVIKKKCREFGIPRWPHRKIKSLDSLIHNLQEEVKQQQDEDEAAAMAVVKRQRMIEMEKEIIERNPFTEIQSETLRFRQDVYKRRHRARALQNQCALQPRLI